MAKLPTSFLPRSLPSTSTMLLTSTARPALTPSISGTSGGAHQVRHATSIDRPKRPFTWTQIIQLSDGSTYTTRTTSPQPVYRSTKDTRNHITWQPSDPSLQNVEIDEAGKLAGFRHRFGTAFDLAPGAALAAQEMKEDAEAQAAHSRKKKGGGLAKKAPEEVKELVRAAENKATEAEAAMKQEAADEDSFTNLMSSYVRAQPSLKGGQVAGKGSGGKKKKK